MKKTVYLLIVATSLAITAPAARAQDATNQAPNRPGEVLRNMTPEQRKQYLAEHPEAAKRAREMRAMLQRMGIQPGELKGLSQEERREKLRAAAQQYVAKLENKKADGGALTPEEQGDLARLQKRLAHANGAGAGEAPNGAQAVDPSGKLVAPAPNQ